MIDRDDSSAADRLAEIFRARRRQATDVLPRYQMAVIRRAPGRKSPDRRCRDFACFLGGMLVGAGIVIWAALDEIDELRRLNQEAQEVQPGS